MPNSPSMAMMAMNTPHPKRSERPLSCCRPNTTALAGRNSGVRQPLRQPWAVATRALPLHFASLAVDWSGRVIDALPHIGRWNPYRTRRSVVALQRETAVKCRLCYKEIHPVRLAMNARVRTCSHACAADLRKRGKAEAVARLRARRCVTRKSIRCGWP